MQKEICILCSTCLLASWCPGILCPCLLPSPAPVTSKQIPDGVIILAANISLKSLKDSAFLNYYLHSHKFRFICEYYQLLSN